MPCARSGVKGLLGEGKGVRTREGERQMSGQVDRQVDGESIFSQQEHTIYRERERERERTDMTDWWLPGGCEHWKQAGVIPSFELVGMGIGTSEVQLE